MTGAFRTVRTADGRDLEVLVAGPEDGLPLVFHMGTPSAAVLMPPLVAAAAAQGLRTIVPSRPGYAGSTARPGRSVADVAGDVAGVLDGLGHDRFVTIGWSGGGPHALACAALLGDRCRAAATLASVAPCDADGLRWVAGMGPENVAEFEAAESGEAALTAYCEQEAKIFSTVTGGEVAAALRGLLSDVDKEALTDSFADVVAESFRRALASGVAGWRDDDLAFVRPWGFELSAIAVPVAVWQGRQDLMVPFAHGRWLADHVPTARPRLYDDEGHVSLLAQMPRIIDDLLDLADRR
jgi:pimeloyl-ACP methyl ester carboxylesterase